MIFRPTKNIYFPNRNWGMKKYQRGILHPVGFWHDSGSGAALDTTITTMGSAIYDADSVDTWRVYGYDGGVDIYSYATFGAIGDDTYTDGGSNSRTISALYYHESGATISRTDDLNLCLNATSISNSDTTFVSMDYNGVNYTRASASYLASTGSCSSWSWLNINPNGPTSGNPAVVINI